MTEVLIDKNWLIRLLRCALLFNKTLAKASTSFVSRNAFCAILCSSFNEKNVIKVWETAVLVASMLISLFSSDHYLQTQSFLPLSLLPWLLNVACCSRRSLYHHETSLATPASFWKRFRLELFKMDMWGFRLKISAICLYCKVKIKPWLLLVSAVIFILSYCIRNAVLMKTLTQVKTLNLVCKIVSQSSLMITNLNL